MKTAFLVLALCLSLCAAHSQLENFTNNILGSTTVLASCFTDAVGMRDNNLYSGYFYAELSKNYKNKDFSALGNLPFGYKLKITYNGKSVIASKGDVGAGGPSNPKLDIHVTAAKALGITSCDNFLANVQIDFLG